MKYYALKTLIYKNIFGRQDIFMFMQKNPTTKLEKITKLLEPRKEQ